MVRLSLFASAIFAVLASGQQLIATSLPACAQQCAVLAQAQTACQTNPSAAQTCFCQYASLITIKTTPQTNLCNGFCSDADWATIATWYNSQACANGGVNSASSVSSTLASVTSSAAGVPASTSAAAAAAASTSTLSPAATSQAAQINAANNQGTNASNYSNGSEWWATHYQWIIMLIVLLIAFAVLGVVGTILFKRHQRRHETVSLSGRGADWAPNQAAHDLDIQGRQALAAAGPITEEKAEAGSRRTRTLTRKR